MSCVRESVIESEYQCHSGFTVSIFNLLALKVRGDGSRVVVCTTQTKNEHPNATREGV